MSLWKNSILTRVKTFFISIILFLLLWEIISLLLHSAFLPQPIHVFNIALNVFADKEIYSHILASLERTIIGFLLAVVIASSIAYFIGLNEKVRKYVHPVLELLRPIPPLAWIPLAILWFGIGNGSSYFIIFIAAFFPILTNVYFGVKSIPTNYKRIRHNYFLNKIQNFVHIVFPFTTPYLLEGCKTSIGLSWMAVVAAEMIASNSGLGYFIESSRVLLKTEQVIIGMIIIGIMGYLMHQFIVFLEKKLTSWRYEQNV